MYRCSICHAYGQGLEKTCPRPTACRGRLSRASAHPGDVRGGAVDYVAKPAAPDVSAQPEPSGEGAGE